MILIEVVAKNQQSASDLATALAEDDRLRVVRAQAIPFPYRPHPETEVVIACGVSLPPTPAAGPKTVLLTEGVRRARRDHSVRATLPLDSTVGEIAAAVVAAQAGLYAVTADQLPPGRDDLDIAEEHLTARELQVLRMMADGARNKDIAAELRISTNTAKFHVAQVLAKLHASSRAEAVRIGIRRGLILV